MDYEEALKYIHSVSWLGSKPGLSRTRKLLSLMGDPQKNLRFIHVAGTNGKGSTCAMLAQVLTAAGYKTGLYTSPFITRFNDRFRIDGRDMPDGALAEVTAYVKRFADTMEDAPTEFELVTAIGLEYFYREKCDVVVLEVGMGGELDSTNVIDAPVLAVITELALDHTAVLGGTIGEIAGAKAGIIKPGCTVLSADNTKDGAAVIGARCAALGCPHFTPDYEKIVDRAVSPDGISFTYKGLRFSVPLCGVYQFRNAAMALKAAELLNGLGFDIGERALRVGLAGTVWHARFEMLSKNPPFVYDGGHNPQGVAAAVESYRACFGKVKPVVLIGLMADKDYKKEIEMLTDLTDVFVSVTPNNPRSLSAEALAEEIRLAGGRCTAAPSVKLGVKKALELAGGALPVLATGSLYLYAEVQTAVKEIFGA